MNNKFEEISIGGKILKIEKPNFNPTVKRDKEGHINEQATKHWKHKPYKCDFGGGKNEKEETL